MDNGCIAYCVGENYTRNEWRRCENYTRNEWKRCENYTRNEWRRGVNYTRNEWRRCENYTQNEWGRCENYTRNEWRSQNEMVLGRDIHIVKVDGSQKKSGQMGYSKLEMSGKDVKTTLQTSEKM
jgi:hypothetical protein